MKSLIVFIAIAVIFVIQPAFGQSGQVSISDFNPHQGDTVLLKFPDKNSVPQSVSFNNIDEPVFTYKNSLVSILGIGAGQAPGNYDLKIGFTNGQSFTKTLRVLKAKVPVIDLPIPKQVGLSPGELLTSLASENAVLNSSFASTTPRLYFTQSFGLPLSDNRHLASVFGEIRNTGGNMVRHLGLDFAAPKGASVWAINGGKVIKAYEDRVYGNIVVLDHGEGIYSLYLHLNAINVKAGDMLQKGNLIGWVGATGLATAPHLHLSVKIGTVSVNPLKFVSVFASK